MAERRVAIIGCGQLAQMMAQEGRSLGITFSFVALGEESTVCVQDLGEVVRVGDSPDAGSLYRELGCPEVITTEREDVPPGLLRALQEFCPVYPQADAVEKTQHRLREKLALLESGVPVAPFLPAENYHDVCAAIGYLGYPAFIKACESGYDGKNQWRVDSVAQLEQLRDELAPGSYVVEKGVPFSREVSIVGVRSASGETRSYPLTENRHENGTLLVSRAPAADGNGELETAQRYLATLLDDWDYVGVLTMECFVTRSGILVNELAPRVHNSGHWTLAGAPVSQFANHLRAILGMPLGDTTCAQPAAMVNMLGVDTIPRTPNEGVWLYGKRRRPGRKLGHVIMLDESTESLDRRVEEVLAELYTSDTPERSANA
ncbi:5-(carboxyamino)imidazole ribonucleotide synthase [Microbulbifer yueqingensis]|uniref:N5-carboxyaminoimidazole ribonucleotide synthase n=2 Tax=Microbulbifer yueqingensis TaxID=658219 RepID=A0A1G9DY23_9GAMM|nr:5-(carboxyamino)imidazole ribonucleotide synthase [Microbulbifer yueqingensis]